MAISVFNNSQAAQKLLLLPRHSHKVVTPIRLDPTAGKIEKNGAPNHFSWWRATDYPVLANVI